ncbi:hypothetical protein BIV25_08295 [Streptomyces sp. MUSC 14]|nr:hypothetical protein BIV25_08295 [Streptomyces sp. MUSC 14]
MYRDEKTGTFTEPPELSAGRWAGFGKAADRLSRLLLNDSDVRYTNLNLCLDTGHVAYVGGDNADLVRRFGESPPAGVPNPADVVAELSRLDAELSVIVAVRVVLAGRVGAAGGGPLLEADDRYHRGARMSADELGVQRPLRKGRGERGGVPALAGGTADAVRA